MHRGQTTARGKQHEKSRESGIDSPTLIASASSETNTEKHTANGIGTTWTTIEAEWILSLRHPRPLRARQNKQRVPRREWMDGGLRWYSKQDKFDLVARDTPRANAGFLMPVRKVSSFITPACTAGSNNGFFSRSFQNAALSSYHDQSVFPFCSGHRKGPRVCQIPPRLLAL